MYLILWEFRTKAKARGRFVRAYGPRGAWGALFGKARGYVATRLIADPEDGLRFVTVDVWRSRGDFARAKRKFAAEYAALDAVCEKLTTSERRVGAFSVRAKAR